MGQKRWSSVHTWFILSPARHTAPTTGMENTFSKLALALVLLAFIPLISATTVTYTTCGRKSRGFGTATVQDVRITPCSDPRRCVLKKNTNVAIEIDYTPTQNSTGPMTASAAWAMSNAQLPLPNMDTDACKTTTCPVKIGTDRRTLTTSTSAQYTHPATTT